MKLLNKTSLIIITVTLFIFFLGGIGFFQVLRSMIVNQVDVELKSYSENLVYELNQFTTLEKSVLITENKVQMKNINAELPDYSFYSDTILFDRNINQFVPHRMYRFTGDVDAEKYEISVFRSTVNAENLMERVIVSLTIMLVIFILCLYFMNRIFFQRIWNDFFRTIDVIRDFNLSNHQELILEESEIEEFQTLNTVISQMTKRIQSDYINLKEFTGNVSHELQTPLAVMKSRIEILLQDAAYSENQIKDLISLLESVNRLSAMNKSLILLTKIENRQFEDTKTINLKDRITFHLANFEELLEIKALNISKNLHEYSVEMSSTLADILILNLLKNAIRHNISEGEININLENNRLTILNSGSKPSISEDKMFKRFMKSSDSKDSIGLGLAIVKKICELYLFDIQYKYVDEKNIFTINFKTD